MTIQTLDDHIARVCSYIGCGAQKEAPRFGSLVCPKGPPGAASFFCIPNRKENSSCGVVALGCLSETLREMGEDGNLSDPIIDSRWENRMVDRAQADGAYFTSGSGRPITKGCIVYLLNSFGQHWTTTVEDPDPVTGACRCVGGGHTDAQGYQLIQEEERIFHGTAWEQHSGKPVVYFIDCGIILEKARARYQDLSVCGP